MYSSTLLKDKTHNDQSLEQKESWKSTLEELSEKIKDTIASEYMYSRGEVATCGTNPQGDTS